MTDIDTSPTANPRSLADDRLRGVSKISDYLGETERRTYYLLENAMIVGWKEGRNWVSSKSALDRQHHTNSTGRVSA